MMTEGGEGGGGEGRGGEGRGGEGVREHRMLHVVDQSVNIEYMCVKWLALTECSVTDSLVKGWEVQGVGDGEG